MQQGEGGQVRASGSPKQRSRSTVSDRQPWGQLLSRENESVFGKFDPLRTLHFLAGELQTKLPGSWFFAASQG